jgi:O-antigen/teichoic acid export membrane protein
MRIKPSTHIFVWFALFLLISADDAHAYIDLGTGSMLIQSTVAAIAGGLFIMKTYWHKIKTFFSRKKVIRPELEKDQANE